MESQNSVSNSEASFIRVGKVKDAHGIRGEIFVVMFSGEAPWLGKMKEVRLVRENSDAPAKVFGVKSARLHKNGIIVKSADIVTRNDAEALKGSILEIPDSFMVSARGEEIYLREIHGFAVSVHNQGEIGKIIGFLNNGAQDLLVVRTASGEFEIPFVKAFTDRIDYTARMVHMTLPPGLLGDLDDEDDVRDDGGDLGDDSGDSDEDKAEPS